MINETTQQQILDYIDNTLDAAARKEVEELLTTNEEARIWYEQVKVVSTALHKTTLWQPSSALRESFDAMLQQEIQTTAKSKQVFFTPTVYRVAAAILLLLTASGIGYWYSKQQAKDAELLALREEMKATRKLVFDLLQNDQSASQRMVGVKAAFQTVQKDDAIVKALIQVMNEDDNMNVRMASIEALGRFSDEALVRTALVESLPKQTDPAVQIALIHVLVVMKEQEAVKSLKKIIEDENVIETVRDEAHAGIIKLS